MVAKIGAGLCVLVGISADDATAPEGYAWMAKKITSLKFFGDSEAGKMWKKNLKDVSICPGPQNPQHLPDCNVEGGQNQIS